MTLKDDKDYKEFMAKLNSLDECSITEAAEMFNKQIYDLTIERNNKINDMLETMVDGGEIEDYSFNPAPTNECDECFDRELQYCYSKQTLLGYMRMAFDFGVANRL